MNIGIITYDFLPFIGGQGRYVYEIYNRLGKNSNNNVFVFSPSTNDLPNHIKAAIPGKRIGMNLLFSIMANRNIAKWIQQYSLDLVHFQGGPGGVFLFKRLNIPVIYTVHHTYYQQYRLVPNQWWKWIFCSIEKASYKKADSIICVSRDTKEVVEEKYNIRPEKVIIIPDGVDNMKFYPLNDSERIKSSILFVGRLDKRKGIDFLVKTLPLVKKEIPDIKLFIVGRGKLRKSIAKFSRAHNLDSNIEFLGFIPDEDLVGWYNQVQLVVVPSIFEGFGMTATEAIACSTPVIGTKVPGLVDIIEDKKNGLLVEFADSKALSIAITRLIQDDKSREAFSIEGRKTAVQRFNWDVIIEQIEESYRESCVEYDK